MELRQLAALVAVADEGTFSGAAAALHTVQSNISTHVRRLERELGAQLVDRAGNRLTEEGEIVVERARRIHAELDALVADVSALRSEVTGTVRVGVISSTARWLVPLLLTAMRERHPNVDVVVVDASTTSLAPQVEAGRLDLAVVNLPCDDDDLVTEPMFGEEFLLVIASDHPLATHDDLSLADLADLELLLPPAGTAFRTELDDAAAAIGVQLRPLAELDGVRLTASLAFAGYGPAILPATAVLTWARGRWTGVPLRDVPRRHVGLLLRRRGLPSAPARALLDVLRDTVSATAGDQPGVYLD